jgi:hypothetical protein
MHLDSAVAAWDRPSGALAGEMAAAVAALPPHSFPRRQPPRGIAPIRIFSETPGVKGKLTVSAWVVQRNSDPKALSYDFPLFQSSWSSGRRRADTGARRPNCMARLPMPGMPWTWPHNWRSKSGRTETAVQDCAGRTISAQGDSGGPTLKLDSVDFRPAHMLGHQAVPAGLPVGVIAV